MARSSRLRCARFLDFAAPRSLQSADYSHNQIAALSNLERNPYLAESIRLTSVTSGIPMPMLERMFATPVDLLTREALQLYHRTLRPGGIVLLHLSNRHYDLIPVANATARSAGLGVLALAYAPGTRLAEDLNAAPTSYVIVGDWPSVERFRYRDWSDSRRGAVFTDDFANLLSALE